MQVRCLHCHEPMQVAEESDFSSLVCSSCGGTFSLVGEQTVIGHNVKGESTAIFESISHFELIDQSHPQMILRSA